MRRKRHPAALVLAILALTLSACGDDSSGGSPVADDCEPKHEFETVSEGKLTVAVPTYKPASWIEGDELKGIDGELVAKFAQEECLELELQPGSGSAVVPAVQNGRADLTVGAWYRTEERSKVTGLSAPIYTDLLVIVSKDGWSTADELAGHTVGTIEGYSWVDETRAIVGADNLKTYPDPAGAYQDLGSGRTEAVLDGLLGALPSAAELGDDYVVEPMEPTDQVFASQEAAQVGLPYTLGNTELGEALDAFINESHENGYIVELLKEYDVPESAADVGDPRLL